MMTIGAGELVVLGIAVVVAVAMAVAGGLAYVLLFKGKSRG